VIMADIILNFNALFHNNELTDDEKRVFLKDITKNKQEIYLKVGNNDRTEVNQVTININKMLGLGGFGAVYSGKLIWSQGTNPEKKDVTVAIKTVMFDVSAMRELAFLDRFQHHNILKYYGYYLIGNTIGMVLEKCNFSLSSTNELGKTLSSMVNPFK
jgi:serine/threonine protein kinase